MDYADIATGFATTFLGAFLAFGLENLRERRRLREWVRQHLVHLRIGMLQDQAVAGDLHQLFADQRSACGAWIAAAGPEDVSEEQWTRIAVVMAANAPDFSAVLRSDAITVLPPTLAAALSETEVAAIGVEKHVAAVVNHREHIMPLWFERTVPLSPAQVRRVIALQETIDNLGQALHTLNRPLQRMLAELDRWLGKPAHDPVAE